MALVFADGFDHYSAVDILKKWGSVANWTPGDGQVGISPLYARPPGGMGLRFGGSVNKTLTKPVAAQAGFVVGGNVYLETLAANILWTLRDSGTNQLELRIDAAGRLVVTRNGTGLATSANVLALNTWYHVEYKATIHNTTGTYEVRVNGSSTGWIPAATGQNTRTSVNNSINELVIGGLQNWRLDDLYLLNGTAPNNDFLGPQKILSCYPNAAGNYAQWASNYAANFAAVNEPTGDDDMTFNQSSTPNQIDSFVYDDVPAGTISAVQHTILARQDIGSRTIAPLQRSGSTDYVGTTLALAGSHLYLTDPWDVDPATGAAWTTAGFNAAEFGYKEIS